MSGVIASVVGTARGSSAVAPTITYQPGPTLGFCGAGGPSECIGFYYQIQGTAPITYNFYRDGSLFDNGTVGGNGVINTWLSFTECSTQYDYGVACWYLTISNSAGSTSSGNTKTIANWCSQNCFCTDYPGGPYNGASWGCYNCNEVYYCPACEYDCSCDNAFGYGTYGCNCGPEDQDCAWCYPNCPYGQTWCPSWTYCPCGDSCSYGDTWCETSTWLVNYYNTPETC